VRNSGVRNEKGLSAMRTWRLFLLLALLLCTVGAQGQPLPLSYQPSRDGPEDVTDLDLVVYSEVLNAGWRGAGTFGTGVANPQARIRWMVERRHSSMSSLWEQMAPAMGTHRQPVNNLTEDSKGGLFPVWRPGTYRVSTKASRMVQYETSSGEMVPREEEAGPVRRDITVFDTTPPRIQIRLSQDISGSSGTIDVMEAQQDGQDVITGPTSHKGVLVVQGAGFDGSLVRDGNPSGANVMPTLVLNAGDNPQIDIGEVMAASGRWPSSCSMIPDSIAYGFHIFEDIPLVVEARVTDNYEDYRHDHDFSYYLQIEQDSGGLERMTLLRSGIPAGTSAILPRDEDYARLVIHDHFKEPNYPLRETIPDETGEVAQRYYFLHIFASDRNGCCQGGQPNISRVRIPIFVHDITPVCHGTGGNEPGQNEPGQNEPGRGLTISFTGRNIDESITIIEDPVDQEITELSPKTVRFIINGGHIVDSEPFETEFLRELIVPGDEILSVTDFGNICADSDSDLKEAVYLPEKTRIQIAVSCRDNYSIDHLVNDTAGVPPDVPPFIHWRIEGLEGLDPSALDCPTEAKFPFANFTPGYGFLEQVDYRFRFVLESRDKAGNEIMLSFPIYIIDTRYVFQEIWHKDKPLEEQD